MKVRVNETDLDEDDKTNQPNEDGAIIDTSDDFNSFENKQQAKINTETLEN